MKAIYRKRFLPNYGVFDEERYFAAGRDLVLLEARRGAGRRDDLRGHVAARAAGDRPGARGRAAARQRLGLAVPRRQGPRARGDVPAARPGHVELRRVRERGRRPGRAGLRRPLVRARRRGRGARAGAGVRGGAPRRRRRPDCGDRAAAVARRGGARWPGSRSGRPRPTVVELGTSRGQAPDVSRLERRAPRRRARADAARARARAARLRRQERLQRDRRRACRAGSTRR